MEDGLPRDFPRTLGALLDRQAERFSDRPAIASDRGGRTYAELRAGADRVARALLAAGVTKGARVGLLAPNWPEWLEAAFGVLKTGALLVGLNTLGRARELEYALRLTDVAFLVSVSRFLKHDYAGIVREIAPEVFAGKISPRAPYLRKIVFLDSEAWADFLAAGEALTPAAFSAVQSSVAPVDPAVVFFTSGSTAAPKAAVHTHASLTHNAWWVSDRLGIEPEDRTWTALPLFFSGGFCLCAMSSLARGACVVLNEVFEPEQALAKLERERATVMAGWNHVPLLLELASFDRSRLSLRKGVGGNLELADRFLAPGHAAVGCYGMTENATVCFSARWDDPPEVRRTFGRPMPGVVAKVVSPDDGRAVAPGEEGEIWVRSPAQMSHYYGMTPAECFDTEGFFHTGDLGFFDAGGCLHFTGRLKDVIKTMGVNVAAPEVEQALEAHPSVKRAHVVGVSHPVRGENVAAFIVAAEPGLTEAEVVRFLKPRLASYKTPRHFFFCGEDEIPMSASNKVEKRRLRERAEREIRERSE